MTLFVLESKDLLRGSLDVNSVNCCVPLKPCTFGFLKQNPFGIASCSMQETRNGILELERNATVEAVCYKYTDGSISVR